MKQNAMFPNLVQKFISDEELQPLIELVGYEDTARKLDVKTLIQYLVAIMLNGGRTLGFFV